MHRIYFSTRAAYGTTDSCNLPIFSYCLRSNDHTVVCYSSEQLQSDVREISFYILRKYINDFFLKGKLIFTDALYLKIFWISDNRHKSVNWIKIGQSSIRYFVLPWRSLEEHLDTHKESVTLDILIKKLKTNILIALNIQIL